MQLPGKYKENFNVSSEEKFGTSKHGELRNVEVCLVLRWLHRVLFPGVTLFVYRVSQKNAPVKLGRIVI
jgi:hypothetical protein